MVVSCGHTFGGLMLRKVIEMVSQTSLLVPIKLLNVQPWWHLLRSMEKHVSCKLIILFLDMKVESLFILLVEIYKLVLYDLFVEKICISIYLWVT